ncbi:MAG: hypothetical protein AAGH38_06385 [Pseudomonadota bacterium]
MRRLEVDRGLETDNPRVGNPASVGIEDVLEIRCQVSGRRNLETVIDLEDGF